MCAATDCLVVGVGAMRLADERRNAAQRRRRPADARLDASLVDLDHDNGCLEGAIERREDEDEAERSKWIIMAQQVRTKPPAQYYYGPCHTSVGSGTCPVSGLVSVEECSG